MCNCKEINTCGETIFSTCVKYEGFLPLNTQIENECDATVHDALEDLYNMIQQGSSGEYSAGAGLELNSNIFSAKFGTEDDTVMMGSWRPTWDDVTGKPEIPQEVNLIEGDNITIVGTYPNYTISSSGGSGASSLIETISIANTVQPIVNKNVNIPYATGNVPGVVKVGSNLSISGDGVLNADLNTYTAGVGLTLNGNQFRVPITTVGSGTFVQSIQASTTGLTVNMGTPVNTQYSKGNYNQLDLGVDLTGQVWDSKTIHDWVLDNTISVGVSGFPAIASGNVNLIQGTGISLTSSGNNITISSTGSTYTKGTLIELNAGTSTLGQIWDANTLKSWLDSSRLGVAVSGNTPITQGNLSLIAGTNVTLSQTGNNITINSTGGGGGTTYSAGNGLTLSGTTFGQTITTSGAGSAVAGISQTPDGFQVIMGTPMSPPRVQTINAGASLTVNTLECEHTFVYADAINSMNTIIVGSGDFDGQMITVVFYGSQDKIIEGDLQVVDNSSVTNSSNVTGCFHAVLFWNEENQRWVVKIIE